jgi:hypothetical protein
VWQDGSFERIYFLKNFFRRTQGREGQAGRFFLNGIAKGNSRPMSGNKNFYLA